MAKTVTTTIRLDEELKKELTHDLDIMRLNTVSYTHLTLPTNSRV